MRRLLAWLPTIFALVWAAAACGQTAPVLTHVSQVAALTSTQAALATPVRVRALVTFVRPSEATLFILEDGVGIFVHFSQNVGLLPGDLVEVTGVTRPSFKTTILGQSVRVLSHGPLPEPRPARFEDLIQSRWDCQYVRLQGRVLTASLDDSAPHNSLRVRIKVPQGTVDGIVTQPGKLQPADLLDAEIQKTGVAGGQYDGKMQLSGVMLNVNSWQEIVILKPPATNPWQLPVIPMDKVVFGYRNGVQSQRVRIVGTLTYYEPGALAVLDSNGRSMMVRTGSLLPLHAGQGVEATGYPVLMEESIGLDNAQLRPTQLPALAPPQTVDWESTSIAQHTFDLVAMEGEVVGVLHDDRVDLFLLQSEGHLFSGTLRHSSSDAALVGPSGLASPTIGSRVRVTGVCFVDGGNHWRDRLWFDLRMRSMNDITILHPPSWWTVKRMAYIVMALSLIILVAVIWVGMLDRRLRRQTAILARQSQEDAIRERQLARLEQQRSHILERVSSSAPLSEVLGEIQTLVSSRLFGGPSSFELHSAVCTVQRPSGPGVVCRELFSPDGTSLGYLVATPLLQRTGEGDLASTLEIGARLAELAIDTRRLYSDLHHRSEYDLLTDIPNRFSMERRLNELMLSASRNECVFGLIYVDLDHFKQVNDLYGHRIGDLYLQEATRRMKVQLRNGDMMARIGGDEFIALAPSLRSRADAEEIAVRIERCFDEPFNLEDYQLFGTASIGLAVYPQDGCSKEELQRRADSAMYAHKQEKRQQEGLQPYLQSHVPAR
jgi:diguanylate cyclase (GGDEF)-like protein